MDTSIFYNCDINFLYPTLISILSLREKNQNRRFDIYVALEHDDNFDISYLGNVSHTLGIKFISISKGLAYGRIFENWRTDRIPPITFLKFEMFDLLPSSVNRIIYIDPDTLIDGNIDYLLDWPVRPGTIGAIEDALTFYEGDWSRNGRFARSYTRSLGLTRKDGYFNAGVILADRAIWTAISRDALCFITSNKEKCIYLDQSAMNAVVAGRKTRLSPIWNYQSRFRYWGEISDLSPKIFHFTGAMKPWLGRLEPWTDVHNEILRFTEQTMLWGFSRPELPSDTVVDHNKQFSSPKNKIRKLLDIRLNRRLRLLRKLHAEASI